MDPILHNEQQPQPLGKSGTISGDRAGPVLNLVPPLQFQLGVNTFMYYKYKNMKQFLKNIPDTITEFMKYCLLNTVRCPGLGKSQDVCGI